MLLQYGMDEEIFDKEAFYHYIITSMIVASNRNFFDEILVQDIEPSPGLD